MLQKPFDLSALNLSEVTRVYTGKSGCMCGCRGKYHEKPGLIRRIVANMAAYAAEHGMAVMVETHGDLSRCVFLEAPGREYHAYVLYLKPERSFAVGDRVRVAFAAAPVTWDGDGAEIRETAGTVVEVLGEQLVAVKHDRYSHVRDYAVREVWLA